MLIIPHEVNLRVETAVFIAKDISRGAVSRWNEPTVRTASDCPASGSEQ
jgi:hypothetical protein